MYTHIHCTENPDKHGEAITATAFYGTWMQT